MIRLLLALGVGSALATTIDLAHAPRVGDGPQQISVVLTELSGEVRPRVQHLGLDLQVDAGNVGEGARAATLLAEPRRFAHLQIVDAAQAPPVVLFSGLITLADQDRNMVAFRYKEWTTPNGVKNQLLTRVPLVPYTRVDVARDEGPIIATGAAWAVIVLVYVAVMVGLFLVRRRTTVEGEG
ncbi:MAG: hypothetical protein H6740_21420 [Alphaproteobacteria bacterium]|nr:hypothetical protein [Alphaproteobacteria bacterium]